MPSAELALKKRSPHHCWCCFVTFTKQVFRVLLLIPLNLQYLCVSRPIRLKFTFRATVSWMDVWVYFAQCYKLCTFSSVETSKKNSWSAPVSYFQGLTFLWFSFNLNSYCRLKSQKGSGLVIDLRHNIGSHNSLSFLVSWNPEQFNYFCLLRPIMRIPMFCFWQRL